jgi:hypothetical protein
MAGAWPAPQWPAAARHQVGSPRDLNPYGQTFQPDVPPAEILARRPTPAPQTAELVRGAPRSVTLASAKPGIDPESVPRGAPRVLAGFLVSYVDSRGMHWPIFQGANTVGRRGVEGLEIAIEDGTTSSRHATILASACPARMKLEDLGSTNGTFVGSTRLVAGQRRELSDGDQVRFGGFSVIVKII